MPIELEKLRSLFAKPDRTSDSRFMKEEVAYRMDERLSLVKIDPLRILIAGCGDTDDALELKKRFAVSHLTGVDISLPALAEIKRKGEKARVNAGFVCGNFSELPLRENSFNMIWSNLALHWYARPRDVFWEWNRVLEPNGLLMFSTFGSGTLTELKTSFSAIDHYSHVHSFASMMDLGDMLIETGFTEPVLEREQIEVTYKDIKKLFSDVRAFGGNAMSDRRRGLFGKKEYEKLLNLLKEGRDVNGNLSLRFEIIVAHAFKKDDSLKTGQKVIQFYDSKQQES